MSANPTYRVRMSQGKWFVRIYEGFSLDTLLSETGPYTFAQADAEAKRLGIPDGDKGEDGKHE